jgi:hypothetical protein
MSHSKIHSFTGTTDHDFSGLISGELIQFNGINIVSAGEIPLPTISDKGLVVLTATTGNDSNTGIQISNTPYNLASKSQYVGVSINGLMYEVGNGATNRDCYFSLDGTGGGVRLFSAITQNDYFVWNGVISGFELDTNDRVDFYYNI